MCSLNETEMEKSYEYGEGDKMKDGLHKYELIKWYQLESGKI